MKDFNFDLMVSKDVREEVESLRITQHKLITELTEVTMKLAKYELHVHIQDALILREDKEYDFKPADSFVPPLKFNSGGMQST